VKAIVAAIVALRHRTFRAASWLKDLRPFVAAAEDLHSFRELVDGLAAAGDSRFVSIQLADDGRLRVVRARVRHTRNSSTRDAPRQR